MRDTTIKDISFLLLSCQNYIKNFTDLELIEFVLYFSNPECEAFLLARKLFDEFGDLNTLIHASEDKLLSIENINKEVYVSFSIIREFIARSLKCKINDKDIISCINDVINYLKFSMGKLDIENLRILYLNTKNVLLADELMAVGTINQTAIYPREIIKRILFHEAKSIILVHNHPSGNAEPSMHDINLTQKIIDACKTIDVTVHDHIIVTNNHWFSFKVNNKIGLELF